MSLRYKGGILSSTAAATSNISASGVWTLQQQLQSISAGTWPLSYDPFFKNVSLLLPGNGTNGAQNNTFLDSSTNNFTITRNGNTTQGTFSPYGSNWSNYFDGTGDYLTVPDNAAFDLGSGDFTIEAWLYITSGNSTGLGGAGWISQWSSGTTQAWYFGTTSGNTFVLGYTTNGSTVQLISSGYVVTTSLNQWVHFAVSKSGTSVKLFVNGVQTGSTGTLSGTIYNSSDAITLGFNQGAGAGWGLFGYMSNARVVKGTAVYTANFTPPTAPLTAITNTSLLTCQSNRFIDNSANAFAITRNGDVFVQRFSPFSPTAAYSASTIGGSGYFDGSGDNLSIADSSQFNLGTSNYTMEMWVYPTSAAASAVPFSYQWSTAGGTRLILFIQNTDRTYQVYYNGASGSITTTNTVTLNAWNHIALVRNGSTFTVYINGVSGGSTSISITYSDSDLPVIIGSSWDGTTASFFFPGYIAQPRVVIGTAVYTANFTPPTSPLTAITNTQLLCNMTNAGIIDNSMINVLETVGNAQISTSVSKFGGGSMAFDGTGDYLVTPSSPSNILGSGDFTVEFWMYPSNTSSAYRALVASENYNATTGGWTIYQNGTSIEIWLSPGTPSSLITATSAITASTWQHVALSRSSGTVRLFVNGTSVGSASNSAEWTGQRIFIGDNNVTGTDYFYNGYIDELRITQGVARYTANFTVPSVTFPLA